MSICVGEDGICDRPAVRRNYGDGIGRQAVNAVIVSSSEKIGEKTGRDDVFVRPPTALTAVAGRYPRFHRVELHEVLLAPFTEERNLAQGIGEPRLREIVQAAVHALGKGRQAKLGEGSLRGDEIPLVQTAATRSRRSVNGVASTGRP